LIATLVVYALWKLSGVTLTARSGRIDAVTGTVEWRRWGPVHIDLGTTRDVSAVESRLTRMGAAWTPDWRGFSYSGTTLWTAWRECGRMPPIYEIRSVLKAFADASTDAEMREFVRVMQTGTDAERRAAVEAAGEKGLAAMGERAGG
jgi:hypothetical protein